VPSSSKSKGNRGEREVADRLSKLFKLNFERVPNSGAFVGGKNSSRLLRLSKTQKLLTEGDLIVPEELYNMKIECKSYKKFSWFQIFTSSKQLDDWIQQAEDTDKIWFLTFKISYCGTCVVFSQQHFEDFNIPDSFHIYKKDYIICEFNDFFQKNVDNLLQLCENQL
jgi:hypothetical protein